MQDAAFLKSLAGCSSPDTLLAAILKYHPDLRAPVDVEAIAQSAGIARIGVLDAEGASSALHIGATGAAISCAASLPAQRRRFAVAHQLGHFLLKAQGNDRQCANRDLSESRRDTTHRREEMQANRFAAGLLMPKPLFTAFVDNLGKPSVTHLPDIAAAYDVTLEVAVSRYADLSQAMCAFVFIKDGVVRYTRPSRSFPTLSVQAGSPVPPPVRSIGPKDRIAWLPAEVRDWIDVARGARAPRLTMQVFSKANGFQLVMLSVNAAAERRADEEDEKLATEKPKFGQRR